MPMVRSCAEQQPWDLGFPRVPSALLTTKENVVENKTTMSSSPLVGTEASNITGGELNNPCALFY